jgi:hypothetical protein
MLFRQCGADSIWLQALGLFLPIFCDLCHVETPIDVSLRLRADLSNIII